MFSVVLARGCVVATGPAVDELATRHIHQVPPTSRQQRVRRDGAAFHITLLAKDDLPLAEGLLRRLLGGDTSGRDGLEAVTRELRAHPFIPLGNATAGPPKGRAYFVPLLWPAAHALRSRHGLPFAELHCTLGFDRHDLHDEAVRKGARQLERLPASLHGRRDALPGWDAAGWAALAEVCSRSAHGATSLESSSRSAARSARCSRSAMALASSAAVSSEARRAASRSTAAALAASAARVADIRRRGARCSPRSAVPRRREEMESATRFSAGVRKTRPTSAVLPSRESRSRDSRGPPKLARWPCR